LHFLYLYLYRGGKSKNLGQVTNCKRSLLRARQKGGEKEKKKKKKKKRNSKIEGKRRKSDVRF